LREMSTKVSRPILIYEYTCSGGLLTDEHTYDAASLMGEGWAMLAALATDLAKVPGLQVQVLADHRGLPGPMPDCELIPVHSPTEERALLSQLTTRADWTIIIAPETDGALYDRAQWVEAACGRLLGAASPLVSLLGNKHRTAEHLRAHGVPCPSGTDWRPGGFNSRLSSPLVVKPLDGAGSQSTYLLNDQHTLDTLLAHLSDHHGRQRSWRIEAFRSGVAASVLALCGPAGVFLLPPCYQRINFGKTITYHGGAYPIRRGFIFRAECYVRRALESLPKPIGFIGIDMVLGEDPDGRDDSIIEINPRLTTSYVGLREASRTNLAKAMLDVAEGKTPDLSFDETPLEFDPDGTVRRVECDDSSSLSFSIDGPCNPARQAIPTSSQIQSGDNSPHSRS
jgi:predicted ATP-grasp superfamily ATP-dependent carboligase